MSSVALHAAGPQDADALAALAGELGYSTSGPVMRRRLGDVQKSANDVVLVATRAGSVVGWIHVATTALLESDAFAEIRGLVVTGSERGSGVVGSLGSGL
ncbi:MAG TPA: hypothetical protein VII12_03965 [Thermoanaerobaculia bacterium]|jgi:N-acetylglutamate synthase-like GNAT family acetyltransferase